MFFLVHDISEDVDQAFDAGLQFDECAVVGDVGDAAVKRALSGYFASMPARTSSNCFMPSEMRWVSWLI